MEKIVLTNPDFNFLLEYIEFLKRVIASVKIHVPAKRENCFGVSSFLFFFSQSYTILLNFKLIYFSPQFLLQRLFSLLCKFPDCSQQFEDQGEMVQREFFDLRQILS